VTRRPVVVKFGGASLADPVAVAARLASLRAEGWPVIAVVSARAGVTDRLVRAMGHPTDSAGHRRTVADLRALHPGEEASVERRLGELARAFTWSERRAGLRPAAVDGVLAFGERLAVDWLVPRLRAGGLPAVAVDSAHLGLWTDGRHGAGTIRLDRSRRPVRAGLIRLLARGELPVLTGYFGRGADGEPVTLGRGGSDYAASAVGAIVGAEFVELVKPEASILSADPRDVPAAHPIRSLTYEEAEELAEFGARVLHPMTIEPARAAGIELRVRSLRDPRVATIVGPRAGPPGIRAVTGSPRVSLFRLRFPGARGRTGVLSEICRRLAVAGVPVLQVFTSAAVVSVVVAADKAARSRQALTSLVRERGARLDPAISVALLAGIGAGAIGDLPRFPLEMLESAEGISATRTSLTVAVPARDRLPDLRRLHATLLEPPNRRPPALPSGRRAFGPAPARAAGLPDPRRSQRPSKRTT
jgi:aspartate kinase